MTRALDTGMIAVNSYNYKL